MSVAKELAKYAIDLKFEDLPQEVIHQTKRVMLDTIGCAIGGYSSDASQMIQKTVTELGGKEESTVIGSGIKTSCLNAALANGAMVRYLDYNDTAFIIQGETYRTGYHPSEIMPPVLSVCERDNLPGKDAITAIVAGYDLSLSFLEGVTGTGMEKKGWNGDTRGAYIMPIVIGKLLGLDADQMTNAVGIAGSCHAVLAILDTAAEVYTMTKNLRFPTMAYGGILAAFLARNGFTGPPRVIEGHDGFIKAVMNGEYDIKTFDTLKGKFAIMETCIKSIIADFSSHGHLTATLTLARENNINPDDVAKIKVTTSARCANHTGDIAKKYPQNKESADHSSYYLTAIAIVDKEIGPDQFTPEKYNLPIVKELIDKVELIGDPSLDKERPAGLSEITLKDGTVYNTKCQYPIGHARNPMTDEQVADKFKNMAEKYMDDKQMDNLIETIFDLDKIDDVGKLNQLMVFKNQ
ncbi:MmgE/PrpD family protein [Spirochaetota bacterium]